MTIKSKISFYVSIISTLLFGVVCLGIITLFSSFRKQEFEARLNEKAQTAIRLLIDVKEVDNNLLQIIDQNTINKLYNEKTLIFNDRKKLIYSSLDDTKVNWKKSDLTYLKENKSFFKTDGDNEIYGLFYDSNAEDYFVIISANDNYGKRKLNFLAYILIGAYVLFIIASWLITFTIIKKQFIPLDIFHKKIRDINDLNSERKLELNSESNNEINLLSNEFNHMMGRISDVYQKQREFTAQASHELRTPLARILAQVENQMQHAKPEDLGFLITVSENVSQLKELINSLLVLSRIDNQRITADETSRVDEALYNCIEKVSVQHPALKVNFSIDSGTENLEELLEVKCNQSLLQIAFGNLLKNAYLYATDKSVDIEVSNLNGRLVTYFRNSGNPLPEEEVQQLFQPFKRGKNARNTAGLGLGLRIVQRILVTYNFDIKYSYANGKHTFTVVC